MLGRLLDAIFGPPPPEFAPVNRIDTQFASKLAKPMPEIRYRWEIERADDGVVLDDLLAAGWEPFAADGGYVYLRKHVLAGSVDWPQVFGPFDPGSSP